MKRLNERWDKLPSIEKLPSLDDADVTALGYQKGKDLNIETRIDMSNTIGSYMGTFISNLIDVIYQEL